MFDLKLTKNGDINCHETPTASEQRISFYYGQYSAQLISFDVYSSLSNRRLYSAPQQTIRFMYDSEFNNYRIDAALQQSYDEVAQAIAIKLKTEVKDISVPNIGTEYFKYKHFVVKEDKDMKKLRAYILAIAQEIMPDIQVEIQFVEKVSTDNFSAQTLEIVLTFPEGDYRTTLPL